MQSIPAESEFATERGAEPAWRRWLIVFIAALLGLAGALYLAVVLLDPFSTGRFTPLRRIDIAIHSAALSNAGRARDPSFDSAIIGNSVARRLDPARLNAATGRHFVLLAVDALLPDQQLVIARAFARHHGGAASFVFVLDPFWCADNIRAWPRRRELQEWLYQSSDFEYLSRIFFPQAIEAAGRRLLILAGRLGPARPPNGYEPVNTLLVPADMPERMRVMRRPRDAAPASAPFPLLDLLARFLPEVEPQTNVLLLFPPAFVGALPEPGSAADRREAACKAAARRIAAGRPRTEYLDLRTETEKTRVIANFYDTMHYRDSIAREIEQAIAARFVSAFGAAR